MIGQFPPIGDNRWRIGTQLQCYGGSMIIPILKLWLFGTMILALILCWRWEWASVLLGVVKKPVEDPDRPWWKRPEEEWVEREPTYLDAIYFSFAWPLHLFALAGSVFVYLSMNIVEMVARALAK